VTTADLTIGTSAGSTAAAQLAARPRPNYWPPSWPRPQQPTGPVGSDRGRAPTRPVADHLERMRKIIASAEDAADLRRRMGAAALDWMRHRTAPGNAVARDRRRAAAQSSLAGTKVLITAVDAQTGEPVVFDRDSGVDLTDAVAASCASGCPTGSGTADTSTAATDPTPRMPIWPPDTSGCWCCHPSAAERCTRWTGARILPRRSTTTRPRQQSRDDLPGQRLRAPVRRQCDGSVAASARRSSWLRQGRARAEQLTEFW
jgi:hypothetical protein